MNPYPYPISEVKSNIRMVPYFFNYRVVISHLKALFVRQIRSDMLIYQQLSFIKSQVIFLPDIPGFQSMLYQLTHLLQIHVDKNLIKIHPINIQCNIIQRLIWKIFYASEHFQKNLRCLCIFNIRGSTKIYFRQNLHLIAVFHLNKTNIIPNRYNITDIPLITDPHEIKSIRVVSISSKSME